MRIPKSVKVGAVKYKVKVSKGLKLNDTIALGICDFDAATIHISKKSQAIMEGTLIHELLEAICGQNDIRLKHERLAVIAEQMYTVLKVNNLI